MDTLSVLVAALALGRTTEVRRKRNSYVVFAFSSSAAAALDVFASFREWGIYVVRIEAGKGRVSEATAARVRLRKNHVYLMEAPRGFVVFAWRGKPLFSARLSFLSCS